MFPKSIRFRLPLSYAGIALLTTLALGTILLTSLRTLYTRQEIAYLENNANTIRDVLENLLVASIPPSQLQSQLNSYAFLTQTRLVLVDNAGIVVADTGDPRQLRQVATIGVAVELDNSTQTFSQVVDTSADANVYTSIIAIQDNDTGVSFAQSSTVRGERKIEEDNAWGWLSIFGAKTVGEETNITLPNVETPFGFSLNPLQNRQSARSNQAVVKTITAIDGSFSGKLTISEGPASGQAILNSVAVGWGIAGIFAMLISALAGWRMSRNLSQPLVTLTETTAQMAQGDLTARSPIQRKDELGTLAQSFNQMADTVEETVATLRRFIADAAHEMHTPLTALATNLSLLEQQPSSHNLTQAQLQLKRLETLTSNLLDLSRLESITQPPSPSMINLTQMVQEIGELYASQAEQAEIEFELQTPESVDVLAYPTQLRQALHNVLDNALKFTLAGGKVILQVEKTTAQTIITVQDTGIGIPPPDLPHLFNRFHRGENAGNYAGNGLGLAIVKAIVNQHNGTIHIQSSPHGTTATITLPR